MLKKFNQLTLVRQFVLFAAVLVVLVVGALGTFSAYYSAKSLERQAEVTVQDQVDDARRLLDTAYSISVDSTDRLASFFVSMFPEGLRLDEASVVKVGSVDAPALRTGSDVLNLNFKTVDAFTGATGGVATVFARKGDDFVRVTTSLKKENGDRAVGTMLGKTHPAYGAMMEGRNYLGKARLFGKEYMTKYVPVKDASGKVAGILFVGFDLTSIFKSLEQSIARVKVGETGYLFVVGTQGSDKGKFVFHPKLAGKDALETRDASGKAGFLEPLLEKKEGWIEYQWMDESGKSRDKMTAFARIEGFGGWSVAGGTYRDEFTRDGRALGLILLAAGIGAAAILVLVLSALFSARLKQVGELAGMARKLGGGDLTARCAVSGDAGTSRNELVVLAAEMNQMAGNFERLIVDVRNGVNALSGSSGEMSRTADNLAHGARKQSEAAGAMAANVEEVGTSVQVVSENAQQANQMTQSTRELAVNGAEVLAKLTGQIGLISDTVTQSASTIENLGEQTRKISGIAKMITEIAEQTNLLALNAAIEAARAGEQGRGFAVVADEVGKLAERTAKSTHEISAMVANIQQASDGAVVGMRGAVTQVQEGSAAIRDAESAIRKLSDQAKAVSAMVQEISGAVTEQASASANMAQHVEAVARMSETNSEEAGKTAAAAKQLEGVAASMEESIRVFRTQHA